MGPRLHKLPRHMSRVAPTVYINMSSIEKSAVLFHWLCFLIFDKTDYGRLLRIWVKYVSRISLQHPIPIFSVKDGTYSTI